jgi:hypothetical protein
MTPEHRLDRWERLARLFANAGRRERRNRHELEDKINIIVNYQIQNEERFAQNEERFARNEERFEKLVETVTQIAEAQIRTETRLGYLIELVERQHNDGDRH